jgi:predicted RNA binding protein YcfA (HicA-like mRNA interferase family)
MKTNEMIRLIEKDGWQLIRQTGSHRVYRHPIKPGTVIVPAHGSKELQKGTETSMASPSQKSM